MSDETPAGCTPLTAEQWRQGPRADHTSLFSREEVEAALRLLTPPDEAAEVVRELYSDSGEAGTVCFYGELPAARASLSDSAAERVAAAFHSCQSPGHARTCGSAMAEEMMISRQRQHRWSLKVAGSDPEWTVIVGL